MSGLKVREHKISGTDVCMALAAIASAQLLIFGAAQSQAQTYHVIHAFTGGRTALHPRRDSPRTRTALHSFIGGSEAAHPDSNVTVDANGNLFGTAQSAGQGCETEGCGVVWEITP